MTSTDTNITSETVTISRDLDTGGRTETAYVAIATHEDGEWYWAMDITVTEFGLGGEALNTHREDDIPELWIGDAPTPASLTEAVREVVGR